MSERLLSGLLALYPAQFRREYGAECARLLRDRFRDERGVMARMRLCADVLNDLVFGVPRLYVAGPTRIGDAGVAAGLRIDISPCG